MAFALSGALRHSTKLTPRAGTRSPRSSGLLLLYLSTTSFFAAASISRPFNSLPTCPAKPNTCPSGLRSFTSSSQASNSAPQYSYHIAASYCAKGNRLNPGKNLYTQDTFDPSKSTFTDIRQCKKTRSKQPRLQSGQDALFWSQVGNSNSSAFGVADGVGGWTESGVDPADFAHGLCDYMACAARIWPEGAKKDALHPIDLLQVGFDEVIEDKSIVGGGSTASLAIAEPDGNVEVANLGDSGFMHVGLNAVRHFTHPQTHGFNTPFQLSKTPERMLVQMQIFGGTSALSDPPNSADVTHHRVRHGDVLIFATDGVWDNLSQEDALSIISDQMIAQGAWMEKEDGMDVGKDLETLTQSTTGTKADRNSLQAKLALALTKEAKDTGLNTRRDGPFAKEVQKWYPGEQWHGGKPDDIAVLVAVVVENSGP